jgi:O-antigen/teichoic acid export membrane protein
MNATSTESAGTEAAQVEADRRQDLTGRSRLVANTAAVWSCELVLMVSGFILPRLIDNQIGQERLGIWDFGWSMVSYLGLVQCGVGSSVNRYVAKYRAAGDVDGLNCAVSSVTCVFLVMAVVVVALTVVLALAVPGALSSRLGEHVAEAQQVTFFLGLTIALQAGMTAFGGVLTGCHYWGLYNAIEVGGNILALIGMVCVLLLGGGLAGLALMVLCGEAAAWTARFVAAHRVCPGLRVRFSLARRSMAWSMFAFGGKTFVPGVAQVLLNQAVSILIVAYIGPAALAMYSRPAALERHARTFVQKFAFVESPTASSLQALNQGKDLRDLLVRATRYAAFIALPISILLAVFGRPILRLWMGPHYEQGTVLLILALGNLPAIIQLPAMSILLGMNLHGRPGVAYLVASIAAVGMGVLAVGPLGWGLVGAAISVTVPILVANIVYVPVYASRHLGVPLRRYLREALLAPVLCSIPFALAMLACRIMLADSALVSLGCGLLAGGAVIAPLYWRYAMPLSIKERLTRWLSRPPA